MSNLSFQERIILPALQLIKHDPKVKRFYFVPGLLSIVFLSLLLVYQSIYTYVVILGKKREALEVILNFLHSDYVTEVAISVVVFVVVYLAVMPIFEAGLIRYIEEKVKGNKVSNSDCLGFGVFRFYPMFEYNNIFSMFKFISLINAFLFAIRFIGLEYMEYMVIVFIISIIFSIIINTLVSYAKYEIVLQNKTVFQAIGTSAKISLLSLKTTLKLYLLMFVVNIRVIINFIIFLIFPLLLIGIVGYVTSTVFLTIALIILACLFIAMVLFLGYMTTVLEVFSTAAWYFAYKEGREKLEQAKADE